MGPHAGSGIAEVAPYTEGLTTHRKGVSKLILPVLVFVAATGHIRGPRVLKRVGLLRSEGADSIVKLLSTMFWTLPSQRID